MIRIYWLTAMALTAAAVVAVSGAQGTEKIPLIKIGMLQGMFRDVPQVQIQAASIPFKRLFRELIGREGDIEVFPSHQMLADRLKTGECTIGVFHGFEYAWAKKTQPELETLVVTVPQARKVQACLVVNKDDAVAGPAALQGECVALHKSSKAHCLLYLDRLRETLPRGCCNAIKHAPMTPENVLDAVANGEMKAALVDVSSLNVYQMLKPGAFDQLRVLSRSDLFPPAVVAYRKGSVDESVLVRIREGLIKASTTAQGRLMLTFWNLKGFADVPADYAAHLEQTYKNYPPAIVSALPVSVESAAVRTPAP